MAPQTKTKTKTNKATLEMFLCALVVCPDKGNFNELHTLHCTLMQNKYNCKLPASCTEILKYLYCIYQLNASSELRFLKTQNDLSKLLCCFLLKLKTSYIIDNAFPHNIQPTNCVTSPNVSAYLYVQIEYCRLRYFRLDKYASLSADCCLLAAACR